MARPTAASAADLMQAWDVPLVKLMLLGDSAVGKSSLLVRFCDGTFEDKFYVTIGMDFKTKVIEQDSKKLRVDVWDTAGHEKFKSITPAFYRSAMGVILTYDVTSEDTFAHIEDWMTSLEKYSGQDVPKILVGNKIDLEEGRTVSRERAAELANRHGLVLFETSAKTGESVAEAFAHLAGMVARARYKDPAPGDRGRLSLTERPAVPPNSGGCKC